jgi:hypothetical protein
MNKKYQVKVFCHNNTIAPRSRTSKTERKRNQKTGNKECLTEQSAKFVVSCMCAVLPGAKSVWRVTIPVTGPRLWIPHQ